MGESVEWLKKQVDSMSLNEKLFEIFWGEDRVVFGALINHSGDEPDVFTLGTIYDSIYDLHTKIRFSFYSATECNLSESLVNYNPFALAAANEKIAEYFVENMAFRTGSIWDLLAQLYNELWRVKTHIDKLYYTAFFHNAAQGKHGSATAKKIYDYLVEDDEIGDDTVRWKGNHAYAKQYRDQMTHRNSPNISTLSPFSTELRDPAVFALKRITEDYLQAVEFVQEAVDEISTYLSAHPLFETTEQGTEIKKCRQ